MQENGSPASRTWADRSVRRPTPSRSGPLRTIDIRTGTISRELPQPGPAHSWGGTLTTATGVVIFCEDGGSLRAVDAATGAPLWSAQTNQMWRASTDDLDV